MSALRRELARSKLSRKNNSDEDGDDYPWPPELWQQARRAYFEGTLKSEDDTRFPVILSHEGPVSTPHHLQELLGLESSPEVLETDQVDIMGRKLGHATICHITYRQRNTMEEKSEMETGIDGQVYVLFKGQARSAIVVKALKPGVTLSEEVPVADKGKGKEMDR